MERTHSGSEDRESPLARQRSPKSISRSCTASPLGKGSHTRSGSESEPRSRPPSPSEDEAPRRSRRSNNGSEARLRVSSRHNRHDSEERHHRRRERHHYSNYQPAPRHHEYRYRSRSPLHGGKSSRMDPKPSRYIGIFGLSSATSEKLLFKIFNKFGAIENIYIVYDKETALSKGYAFCTYDSLKSAEMAKEQGNGYILDGRSIRVDYSYTKGPHEPTPGKYLGKRNKLSSYNRGGPSRDFVPIRRDYASTSNGSYGSRRDGYDRPNNRSRPYFHHERSGRSSYRPKSPRYESYETRYFN